MPQNVHESLNNSSLPFYGVSFKACSLLDLDKVKLLNRFDIKYLIPESELHHILSPASEHYHALTLANQNQFAYQTIYFDTPGLNFYLDHHNRKRDRYKVRLRKYIESNQVFFEIKHKTNKGKTVKSRIERDDLSIEFSSSECKLLEQNTLLNTKSLFPVLDIQFSRTTIVDQNLTERITIDTGLGFNTFNSESHQSLNKICIIEIKRSKLSGNSSIFEQLLRDRLITPYRISKYCTAINFLFPEVKYNRFKSRILKINKLQYGT